MTASGASVQVLTAANLYSSLVGEGEALLRGAFSRAKAAAPAIIFLDEIDAIAGSRETQSEDDHSSRQILSSLLTEMDGIEMAEGEILLHAAFLIQDLQRIGELSRIASSLLNWLADCEI